MDLGLGTAVGGMRIEINTGYSCYLICNNSWHRMALQSITEFDSFSLFSVILVFVCLCLCLYSCICHFYLNYDFQNIPPKLPPDAALSVASKESNNGVGAGICAPPRHYGWKSHFLAPLDIPDISGYQLGIGCQCVKAMKILVEIKRYFKFVLWVI